MSKLVIDYKKIVYTLSTSVIIHNTHNGLYKKYNAIFDTGAMKSAISTKVFKDLLLIQWGRIFISGVNSFGSVFTTKIDITLGDNEIIFKNIEVSICNLPKGLDMLIGMDLITQGNVALTNVKKSILEYKIIESFAS